MGEWDTVQLGRTTHPNVSVFPGSVEHALAVALAAHGLQRDKAGRPYILHVLTVAAGMETDDEIKAAMLHDVVEDSEITIEELKRNFNPIVVEAVKALTKGTAETYDAYIQRVAEDPIARKVKAADLRHNMDLSRIPSPTIDDRARVEKYRLAAEALLGMHTQADEAHVG